MELVTCGSCKHWTPSRFNSEHGAGLCSIGVLMDSLPETLLGRPYPAYPRVERYCRHWSAA